jgi:hypothetical protein
MALTDEQRAMLQLLLEGDQGYADIGSLLGIPPGEVRSRARAALTEMGGADPDSQVQLGDYLLGQADPIGRADAVRHLQNDPEANSLAVRLVSQLRLIAPRAELPEIPAARGGAAPRPAAAAPGAASPAGRGGPSLPGRIREAARGVGSSKRGSQLLVIGGALALLAIVGGLAIGGVFGGDGGGGCQRIDPSSAQQAGLPVIPLEASSGAPERDGCAPTGQAVLTTTGQGKRAQVVLQTNLANLVPSPSGQTYILWLYSSNGAALPLAQDVVGEDGNLTGVAPISNAAVAALGGFIEVRVSLAPMTDAQAAVAKAQKQNNLPQFLGQPILAGQIPNLGQQAGGKAQSGQGSGSSGGGQSQGNGGSASP